MPELPEVETVVRGLRPILVNHSIESVTTDRPASLVAKPEELERHLVGSKIVGLRRRAKLIIIDLSSQYSLVIHLKMTGQLVYSKPGSSLEDRFGAGHPTPSLIGDLPDKTTRVIFDLSPQAKLFFNDGRKFGWVKLLKTDQIVDLDFVSKLGPDVFDISPSQFRQRLAGRTKTVKACLLDQTIIAGCGNIYADESLWMTSIHPAQSVASLDSRQLTSLLSNLKAVIQESIDSGGSTTRNYIDAFGRRGKYLDFARVYGRAGELCHRCQGTIEKIKVASRSSSYCPNCQVKK